MLAGAAIAIRLVFVRNLQEQTTENLIAVARGIVSEAELDSNGQLKVENQFLAQTILNDDLSFEWFALSGTSVEKMGSFFPSAPLNPQAVVEFEETKAARIESVTLPVVGEETGEQIGYVRVSHLMDDFDETVRQLDIGIGAGIVAAMVLASGGILWLNKQTMQPIEESFQRLKQFTADASHELRSPLMAISSNAEVALKYPEGMRPDDRDAMLAMLSASEQMTSLTEDLLLLARTDKISQRLSEPLILSILLEDLVRLYRPQADCKNIQITTAIEPNLLLRGDSIDLTRAFTNLLQNAIRYTPQGGKVEVALTLRGRRLWAVVKDTGIGIARENLERVFERFWRAERSRSFDDGGSGLGLSIAQAIIHSHGGTIEVTSEVGKGSCFIVSLPAKVDS